MAVELDDEPTYSAAEGAELAPPGKARIAAKRNRFVIEDQVVVGELTMKSRAAMNGVRVEHKMPLIRRPSERSRCHYSRYDEKSEQWHVQDPILGGGTRCASCGEPFGRAEKIGENTYKQIPAARYMVNKTDVEMAIETASEDFTGDLVPTKEIFCCYNQAICNEQLKDRVRKKEVKLLTTIAHLDAVTAYNAGVAAVGEGNAPLPDGWEICALESCGEPFKPYSPNQKCCTLAHEGVVGRTRDKIRRATPAATNARRKGQAKSVIARKENRAKAAQEAEESSD